ncbi:hypothetical protein Trydic_g4112 [Trypoxylus dichotomus]
MMLNILEIVPGCTESPLWRFPLVQGPREELSKSERRVFSALFRARTKRDRALTSVETIQHVILHKGAEFHPATTSRTDSPIFNQKEE